MLWTPDWYIQPIPDCALVPRIDMPQIEESDYTALVKFLRHQGCPVSHVEQDLATLRFHQSVADFDPSRILTMPLDKPILMARDRFILDGNHRAKARIYLGKPTIQAIELHRDFEPSIALLFAFPKVTRVDGLA